MRLSSTVCKGAVLPLAAAAMMAMGSAHADSVIVSNLTANFVDNQGPLSATTWFANSFTNTSLMDLTKIILRDSGPDATASLFSDNAGAPGVNLGTLISAGNSADINGNGDYFFTPTSTIALSPNTNYWVVSNVASPSSNTYWDFTNDSTANIGLGAYSQDSGGSWNALGYTFKFEVDGVTPSGPATPEPGTWAMLCGLGITGSGIVLRRRKRK